MTEWQLQDALTKPWSTNGVQHGDERLMLVAWEVMFPSWKINDAHHKFNEPSIDFIAIDTVGRLVAIELKLVISGAKPAWAVLCQVSHRAVLIERTVEAPLLCCAHDTCMSGGAGRVVATPPSAPLWERHAKFFGLSVPLTAWSYGVRRIVAASRFTDRYATIEHEFNADPERAIHDLKQQYRSTNGEFDRLDAVLPLQDGELPTPVEHLQVATQIDLDRLDRCLQQHGIAAWQPRPPQRPRSDARIQQPIRPLGPGEVQRRLRAGSAAIRIIGRMQSDPSSIGAYLQRRLHQLGLDEVPAVEAAA